MKSDKPIRKEVSIRELEAAAEMVKALRASGRINRYEHKLLIHAFMAGDRQGNLWTLGAQSGKWYKKQDDRWLESQPEGGLFLAVPKMAFEEGLYRLAQLKIDLELRAFRAGLSSGLGAELTCPKCSSKFTGNARFCENCGTALRSAPAGMRCPGCGTSIQGSPSFCRKCGRNLR
jgi:hypothetical protein